MHSESFILVNKIKSTRQCFWWKCVGMGNGLIKMKGRTAAQTPNKYAMWVGNFYVHKHRWWIGPFHCDVGGQPKLFYHQIFLILSKMKTTTTLMPYYFVWLAKDWHAECRWQQPLMAMMKKWGGEWDRSQFNQFQCFYHSNYFIYFLELSFRWWNFNFEFLRQRESLLLTFDSISIQSTFILHQNDQQKYINKFRMEIGIGKH